MKKLFFLYIILFTFQIFSQETMEDAWIFLKDKPNKETFLANPLTMLSQRALVRRNNQRVTLDSLDVPIHKPYYDELKNDTNISILGKSKWLNAIHIQAEVSKINTLISNYSFIKKIEFANKSLNVNGRKTVEKNVQNHQNKFSSSISDFNYGSADNQTKMLKGDVLHQQGLTGKGQVVAVIDAGFPNVNTLAAFKRIRDNNQILGGYNFADRNNNFYSRDSHGTHVLSTIAGYLENQFVGTAPDAKFYLFVTEIAESETVLEETLWVEAAERADSLGVDVINTSLGYTTYDNPNHSHSYADMDGKTTFISRGAEIGASRGMLLVNSVGNSGNSSWKYMGAPADAPSVIAVGSVNSSGDISSFSSFGPTSDNRIKPEILAQGASSVIINYATGEVSISSGTSFSSPIMAGLIACLNQELPQFVKFSTKKTANGYYIDFLKRGVYESSDKFNNPTNQYGYGIPNFEIAKSIYYSLLPGSINDNFLLNLKIYPNPTKNTFSITDVNITDDFSIGIFNVLGKKVLEITKMTSKNIDISNLDKGIYLLKIKKGNEQKIIKLIKE